MKSLKATVLFVASLIGSQAFADRIPAIRLGLTPETGYLSAVKAPETCTAQDQIVYEEQFGYARFLHKCDGKIVGWVEQVLDGAKMELVDPHESTFDVYLNAKDSNGQSVYINIYTCGWSREDDLAKDPSVIASQDEAGNLAKLTDLMNRKAKFKIQLFYNEFVMSGKCIGQITELP